MILFRICLLGLFIAITGCTTPSTPDRGSSAVIGQPINPQGRIGISRNDIPEYDIVPRAEPLPEVDPRSLPPASAKVSGSNILRQTELQAGLIAYRISCKSILARKPLAPFTKKLGIWGLNQDWQPLCRRLINVPLTRGLEILTEMTTPLEITYASVPGKYTGYFEPVYQARIQPVPPFTEPILRAPADLKNRGARATQTLPNGRTRPYPARADIDTSQYEAIAYAHPADVFFLQIQGSGRLQLPDGSTIRAEYAGHNGHKFASTANWLIRNGHISRGEASMQGIRAWMDRAGPRLTRQAMNANPRYIFYRTAPLGDAQQGPKGSTGERLTPLGSLAVDPAYMPYHLPLIVETTAPGLGGAWRGLLISQDTGNAIKGPIRGDIYFGTGERAGNRAGTMNAPGKLRVLLPNTLIERLDRAAMAHLEAKSGHS